MTASNMCQAKVLSENKPDFGVSKGISGCGIRADRILLIRISDKEHQTEG